MKALMENRRLKGTTLLNNLGVSSFLPDRYRGLQVILALLIFVSGLPAQAESAKQTDGALPEWVKTEGVPLIPISVGKALEQYTQTVGYSLVGWSPNERGVLSESL